MESELTPSWFLGIDWTGARTRSAASAGRFDFRAPLGRGGVGEVWRAIERERHREVAIKFLVRDIAREPEYQAAFREEVRSVARLRHPNVIRVIDAGVLGDDAERATGGRMVAGSPFLAMDLHRGGTLLRAVRQPLAWPALRQVLLELLDALAHAHARGMIHRDIKPTNVLFRDANDAHAGVVLSDFGLACLASDLDDDLAPPALGTLDYIAPEQLLGRTSDIGPATDLYSLGCLAWELASGEPPFAEHPADESPVVRAVARPEAFSARTDVPPGFEAWLRTALEPSVPARFRSAADMAFELRGLDGEDAGAFYTLSFRSDRFPEDWRSDVPESGDLWADHGFGLYGLRAHAFEGRYEECDLLWEAFREAALERRVRTLWLSGEAGIGKSRLVEWLGERVRELGVGSVFHARSARELRDLVTDDLRVGGMTVERAAKQIEAALELGDGDETTLVRGLTDLAEDHDDPNTGTEEHVLVASYLLRLAAQRPLVVVLDAVDPVRASDFAARLSDARAPILIVVTGRERPADGDARGFEVGPLDAEAHRRFLLGTLRLAEPVAERIERISQGHPGHAIELVGLWIERGELALDGDVYRWVEPASAVRASVPPADAASFAALWSRRLEAMLADGAPADRDALLLAAVLGETFELDEWQLASTHAGAPLRPELVDRLVLEGLFAYDDARKRSRLRFVHRDVFRDLAAAADGAPAAAELHRACVQALSPRIGARGIEERLAHHLARSGRLEASIDSFLRAAAERSRCLDERTALELASRGLEVAETIGLDDGDPRFVQLLLARAEAAHKIGEVARADEDAANAYRGSRRLQSAPLRARAARLRGRIERKQGNLAAAVRWLSEAEAHARDAGDPHLLADTRLDQSTAMIEVGAYDLAADRIEQAIESAASAHAPASEAMALLLLARVERRRGNLAKARGHVVSSIAKLAEAGRPGLLPEAFNELGALHYREGDLDAAEKAFRRAIEAHVSLGSDAIVSAEANLGMVLTERGDHDAAWDHFESVLTALEQTGAADAHRALLLPSAAAAEAWDAFDRDLEDARSAPPIVEPGLARMAELAGHIAKASGEIVRAERAYELSRRFHPAS
jgi:tetratricopeptide (TPR) repeat protein